MVSGDLKTIVDRRECYTVMVEHEGIQIAYARMVIDKLSWSRPQAIIVEVWVKEDRRGQGFGSRMVDLLRQHASRERCYKIVLSCADDNVAFYEKCGFERHQSAMRCDL